MDFGEGTPHHTQLVFIARGCSYAALILTLWEWLITLRFETLVIWSPAASSRMKSLYSISRYVGIAAQAVNAVMVTFYLFDIHTSTSGCRLWFGFQLVVGQVLLVSLLTSLIVRLGALYNGLTKVTGWLHTALYFQTVCVIVAGTHAICHLEYYNARGCLPLHAPAGVIILAAVEIFSHTLIWVLTAYKAFGLYVDVGDKPVPLVNLITRDGFWVFTSTTVLLAAVLIDAARRNASLTHAFSPVPILFPVYVALVSLSSCRIIMNIYALVAELPPGQPMAVRTSNIELTTLFTSIDTDSP